MKLSKLPLLSGIIIFLATITYLINTNYHSPPLNPSSSSNRNLNQIHYLLSTSSIKPFQFDYDFANNQISFSLIDTTDHPIKVLLSSNKNLYQQVSSLQKALKVAKMYHQQLQVIDLSLNHPYATLEDN